MKFAGNPAPCTKKGIMCLQFPFSYLFFLCFFFFFFCVFLLQWDTWTNTLTDHTPVPLTSWATTWGCTFGLYCTAEHSTLWVIIFSFFREYNNQGGWIIEHRWDQYKSPIQVGWVYRRENHLHIQQGRYQQEIGTSVDGWWQDTTTTYDWE